MSQYIQTAVGKQPFIQKLERSQYFVVRELHEYRWSGVH